MPSLQQQLKQIYPGRYDQGFESVNTKMGGKVFVPFTFPISREVRKVITINASGESQTAECVTFKGRNYLIFNSKEQRQKICLSENGQIKTRRKLAIIKG